MTSSDQTRPLYKVLFDYTPKSLLADGFISTRLHNFLINESINDIRDIFDWSPRDILSTPNVGRKTFRELMQLKKQIVPDEKAKTSTETSNIDQYEKNFRDVKTDLSRIISESERLPQKITSDDIQMKSKVEKIKYNLRKVERAINGAELEQYLPNWEYDGDESYAAQKIIELVKCIIDISVSDFRTKEILSLRLGLADERPPLTLQQIGSLYGVTRERIRQIVNKVSVI